MRTGWPGDGGTYDEFSFCLRWRGIFSCVEIILLGVVSMHYLGK